MITGLWTAKFAAQGQSGSGVAVFNEGKVLGGDTAFYWVGAYQEKEGSLTAKIHVKKFEATLPSILGINEYDMLIEGKVQGNTVSATGTIPTHPGLKLLMSLNKVA